MFQVMFSCSNTVLGCSDVPPVFRVPGLIICLLNNGLFQKKAKQGAWRIYFSILFLHSGASGGSFEVFQHMVSMV